MPSGLARNEYRFFEETSITFYKIFNIRLHDYEMEIFEDLSNEIILLY